MVAGGSDGSERSGVGAGMVAAGKPVLPGAARAGRPINGPHFSVAARAAASPATPRLMMGIPKKLVPSSPVRNMIRRVVRESHRHLLAQHPERLGALSVLVRLLRLPLDPMAAATDAGGRPLRPFRRRPQDRALKRLVRAEIDLLFGRLLAAPTARP
jgi:hypothetical protein